MRLRPLLAALCLSLAACAGNTLLPEPDRAELQQQLDGHVRYLRVACYVTPFFHDSGMLLLTDQAPDELDLVDKGNGQPLNPGTPVRILPPGTPLRIQEISFPTAFEVTTRTLMTPKWNPWVLLKSPKDFHDDKPYVIVLHQDIRTREEFLQTLGNYLAADDPTPQLSALSATVRNAIAAKGVIAGMTPHDVEMAWGYPEQIHIDGPTRSQTWTWPYGKQKAWFSADGLVRWEDHGRAGQ